MFYQVYQPHVYRTGPRVHQGSKLSSYDSEWSYQETSRLSWWTVSSLSIDDLLISQ